MTSSIKPWDYGKPFYAEHTTYRHGDKQEYEEAFRTREAAEAWLKAMLETYGGRVWLNNVEYKAKDFSTAPKI